MDIRKLQRAIVDGLEDVKAQHIVVFNTEHLSPLFERVIIASGTSNRQTKSLASSVRDAVKRSGFPVLRTEGEANGEWIIVNCGAAVVHVMQPSIREYYHLEEIWGDKPVNMKLATVAVRLVKAAEPETVASKKAPGKKAVSKKAAGKQAAGKTATGKTFAGKKAPARTSPAERVREQPAPARKPAAKKAASSKAPSGVRASPRKPTPPAAKAVVTRVVGVKRAPMKAPAAKPPTKTVPSRAAPKAAVKKPAARKSPSRG